MSRVIHRSASDGDPHVCVVGVGFVGEILLKEFGSVFPAIGFDISERRLDSIRSDFASLKNVRLSSSPEILKEATHFCISVPTLLRNDRSVNTDHLVRAIAMVTSHARPGSTIVIESSVSVGMTRALLGPYKAKFHCGMSPERVDPGRTLPPAHEIPKIISALTEPALLSMHKVYSQAFQTVVPGSKPEIAEMTKLFENCYRMINIAYVNEIADACEQQQIDVDEVVAAAATKPFGFQSFKPGLGVGGHCIPVNPFYLMANNSLPLLQQATDATWNRPRLIARDFLSQCKKHAGGTTRILVVGMGFKPGQSVVDFSPAVAFAEELLDAGCDSLAFHDPLVAQEQLPRIRKLAGQDFDCESIQKSFDAIAVCTKQEGVDWVVLKKVQNVIIQWF
ncbi:UDP-N-acetyl-D-glucosamine 6-dehydrogenase [Fulvia fulva]|uniref:UDP-N-acetyl-D-glucosamine 6-dehydrogenase n=1 Tax=Passalora fulva TaxID=5499 RepID=A0A9Q8LC58_PASFU|nr:UDP-N-acetyl-D-glucosamine 6-dehydrogenase [Fulvia fulva]KAK4629317.1 UDP-N-acetyl-D-glucosamine 6-dehydrogenase [Fulvia fulva]KAK4629897.1 UDP-N-acetyl-D-glucosamine 6-dehydrogenase [Fulvia fulva]UJO14665.1 UDP-N-acetyl-D-glucosamine 6-dehydrogenase [Fulvia fulva]WPV12305.1 UDP-N-acetyl-D-glucosamine 6-dehydrogenase [Fulvia fulva]WPV27481.1 UDP-N-acetyl-D-glucosamine 6-dehydrogenase [Fulvia fulva]